MKKLFEAVLKNVIFQDQFTDFIQILVIGEDK